MTESDFWLAIRQGVLMILDAIEKRWRPEKKTTAEIRKAARKERTDELQIRRG